MFIGEVRWLCWFDGFGMSLGTWGLFLSLPSLYSSNNSSQGLRRAAAAPGIMPLYCTVQRGEEGEGEEEKGRRREKGGRGEGEGGGRGEVEEGGEQRRGGGGRGGERERERITWWGNREMRESSSKRKIFSEALRRLPSLLIGQNGVTYHTPCYMEGQDSDCHF